MALPVPNPKAMLANRRYDSDSFRLLLGHKRSYSTFRKADVRTLTSPSLAIIRIDVSCCYNQCQERI